MKGHYCCLPYFSGGDIEAEVLARGHSPNEWWHWDLNLGSLTQRPFSNCFVENLGARHCAMQTWSLPSWSSHLSEGDSRAHVPNNQWLKRELSEEKGFCFKSGGHWRSFQCTVSWDLEPVRQSILLRGNRISKGTELGRWLACCYCCQGD